MPWIIGAICSGAFVVVVLALMVHSGRESRRGR